MDGALQGLLVVELGDAISAPFCGKLLADMGARVVKIERPGCGDSARRCGPFPQDLPGLERSALHGYLNEGKQGITLDVHTPTGRGILLRLLARADVLVDDLRPGERQALGLDYPSLQAVSGRLVVTAVTAFGQDGPCAGYRGGGLQASAVSIAHRLGDAARPPLALPALMADFLAGIHAASATLVAVFWQQRTGEGQMVDISSMECLSTTCNHVAVRQVHFKGIEINRRGYQGPFYPWVVLPCKDGYVNIVGPVLRHWQKYLQVIGEQEWTRRPEVAGMDIDYLVEHSDEIDAYQMEWLSQHTRAELWELFRRHGLPYQPVLTLPEALDSEHVRERNYLVERELAGERVRFPGPPFRMSASVMGTGAPAPTLGRDNEAVLCGLLGMERGDLVNLHRAGVI